ncbi:MAG: hypothetical protein JWQ32_2078 [Marmoricola sp.]|nr:hypothetical protein [Marmoricola sp.]
MTKQLWIPDVIVKELPRGNDPDIVPVGAIFHVAVSEASSLYGDYLHRTDGVESTGYIRRDGTIEQYRPVTIRCDAQYDGNSFGWPTRHGFTSWETQGEAAGEWTSEQLAAIKRIIIWHHTEWAVPLRQAPAWNEAGFGYHALFERWNKSNHSCPGPDRIKQWHQLIVPELATLPLTVQHTGSTRVTEARAYLAQADRLLTAAIADGRTGAVKDARNAVRAALAAHPLPSR